MQRSDFRFCFRFAFAFSFSFSFSFLIIAKISASGAFSTVCVIIILTSYLRLCVVKTLFSLDIILYTII